MNLLFSIVIPTKDRPELLSTCLAYLSKLEYSPDNYEVLVVDDGSENPIAAVCEKYASELPIRCITQPESNGPAAARNRGAELSRGKYLVFLDDDCFPDPFWLQSYETGFSKMNNHALVGRTKNLTPGVIGAEVWCLVVAFQYYYWRDQWENLKIAISNNLAVERQSFFVVGGFNEEFPFAASEDRDFSWRYNAAGYLIGHVPDAIVWHNQPMLNFGNYLKLQYRYGIYADSQQNKNDQAIVAKFSERFGSISRLRYARHLLRFAINQKATFLEIFVLYLGHLFHYLGRLGQRIGHR